MNLPIWWTEIDAVPESDRLLRLGWDAERDTEFAALADGTLVPKADALRWVREIRDACRASDVAFFHKQWGGRTPKAGGRMLDGRTWSQYPANPRR